MAGLRRRNLSRKSPKASPCNTSSFPFARESQTNEICLSHTASLCSVPEKQSQDLRPPYPAGASRLFYEVQKTGTNRRRCKIAECPIVIGSPTFNMFVASQSRTFIRASATDYYSPLSPSRAFTEVPTTYNLNRSLIKVLC